MRIVLLHNPFWSWPRLIIVCMCKDLTDWMCNYIICNANCLLILLLNVHSCIIKVLGSMTRYNGVFAFL